MDLQIKMALESEAKKCGYWIEQNTKLIEVREKDITNMEREIIVFEERLKQIDLLMKIGDTVFKEGEKKHE